MGKKLCKCTLCYQYHYMNPKNSCPFCGGAVVEEGKVHVHYGADLNQYDQETGDSLQYPTRRGKPLLFKVVLIIAMLLLFSGAAFYLKGTFNHNSNHIASEEETTDSGSYHSDNLNNDKNSITNTPSRDSNNDENAPDTKLGKRIYQKAEETDISSAEHNSNVKEYYYSYLDENERNAYDALKTSSAAFLSKTDVSLDSVMELINVLDAFSFDHPEYYWVYDYYHQFSGTNYSYDETGHIYSLVTDIPFDAKNKIEQLYQVADYVKDNVDSLADEYEKHKWIFDYIIENTEYTQNENDQYVIGALLDHMAVCNGFSSAYKFLCDYCGLRCIKVSGDALNDDGSLRDVHAWNLIWIDDETYWVDTTWGSPQFSEEYFWNKNWVNYSYLCAIDDEFLKEHRIDPYLGTAGNTEDHFLVSYPICSDNRYDYYRLMDLYFDSLEESENYIRLIFNDNIPYLQMKYSTKEEYFRAKNDLLDSGRIWQIAHEEGASYNEFHYFHDEAFRTFILEFR